MSTIGRNYIRRQSFLEAVPQPENTRILRKEDKEKFVLCTSDVFVETFNLSDDEQNKKYSDLLKQCANKALEIMFLSRHWDDEQNKMRAHVEWRKHSLV